jgi:predicted ATPase
MIKSIEIENFKCFEKQSLYLGKMTVFTGLNGMGKSSVVQSLLLLRQSFEAKFLSPEMTKLSLNGEYAQIGKGKDALCEFATNEQISLGVACEDEAFGKWVFDYHAESDVLNGVLESGKSPYSASLFSDQFRYLRAERLGPRPGYDMSTFFVSEKGSLGTRGEYAAHFLHEYSDENVGREVVRHPEAHGKQLLYQAEAWLGEISPGTRIKVFINPSLDTAELRYSTVTSKHGSNDYKAINAGFGLTYSLPVILASLLSCPGCLLIVENPEAHLHPKGQFKIGELLCRAAATGAQVIVETHSDHVLNAIRLAVHDSILEAGSVSMNFFRRAVGSDIARIVVDSPGLTKRGSFEFSPEGFFDEIEKRLSQLILPS